MASGQLIRAFSGSNVEPETPQFCIFFYLTLGNDSQCQLKGTFVCIGHVHFTDGTRLLLDAARNSIHFTKLRSHKDGNKKR